MQPDVTQKIAKAISSSSTKVTIIWHGGEPLACGLEHFSRLIEPFAELEHEGMVEHCIQTNATLINTSWCEFFIKHKFKFGVSIDGPRLLNAKRIDWADNEAFERINAGIRILKSSGVEFSAIAVVSEESLSNAKEIYEFFCELGCSSLGINIEEMEGVNTHQVSDNSKVTLFWEDLLKAWKVNPIIRVREFYQVISWMNSVVNESDVPERMVDLFPTITWDGNVVLLSPELAGAKSHKYDDFVVGNIREDSLISILNKASETGYVKDYIRGVKRCRKNCWYFAYCRGGHASNKYFEHGSMDVTETAHCRNTEQRLLDAFLKELKPVERR